MVDQVARVVLALEAPEVAEEVMHFLDRSGRARVVATASDDRQLAEAVRQLEPDAIVAAPAMLAGRTGAGTVLALDTRESVASLRTAIRAGAFLWHSFGTTAPSLPCSTTSESSTCRARPATRPMSTA